MVALPPIDDYVWKISSEKVPHMTLLFLGELEANPDLARAETFISHVVSTSMRKFGLAVDHRGRLGPDSADVIFFKKDYTDQILAAMADMLKDPTIRAAYDSVEQFPEWTPHLTLGYPPTPAKVDTREYGFSWVQFDRVAFWLTDSDGPTFPLKDNERMELAMSTMMGETKPPIEEVLEHHGILGMKWGVRRERNISTLERVSSGEGSFHDKVKALNKVSPGSLIRNRGLKGASANKAANLRALDARISRGEGSARDILAQRGFHRLDFGGKDKDLRTPKTLKPSAASKAKLAEAESKYYQDKASSLYELSKKDPEALIALKTHNDALIVTGKQFAEHLERGGIMDITKSDVYATRQTNSSGKKTGPYVLNNSPNQGYHPKLKTQAHFSSATKEVIRDHNTLTDRDFMLKYAISKDRYAKRVSKGDPNPKGLR